MDQFYFEDGYIESKYYTYVAEAQADLTNYIDSGYISLDYYQGFGIESSLSAELTEKVGEIVDAFGTWTVSVTQTATISHIEGADLFAFSDAALAAAVDRIRDTNIAASVAFDIATDGRVYRDISAEIDAALALSADNERSRAFDSQTQAAFSFASSADRVRSTESTLTVAASLTSTISHIEGADLVANGFASMTVSSTVDYSAAANLNTAFTQTSTVGVIKPNAISLISNSQFNVSKYTGSGRPRNLTASAGTIQSSVKKFGQAASSGSGNNATILNSANVVSNVTDDFILEGWFYPTANENYDLIFFGSKFVRLSFATDGDLWLRWYKNGSTTATTIYNGSTARTLNTWHHWAIVNNSSSLSLYLDGTRLVNYSHSPGDYWTGYNQLTSISISTAASSAKYTDEVNFQVGTRLGVDPAGSSMTVPTAARTNDPATTVFLYHFDADYTDDVYAIQSAQAALSSDFAITASITGTQKFASLVASSGTLTASITVLSLVSADIAAEFNQTSVVGLKQIVNSNLTTAADIVIIGGKLKDFAAALASENSFSIDVLAYPGLASLTLYGQATLTAELTRSITGGVADISSQTSIEINPFVAEADSVELYPVDNRVLIRFNQSTPVDEYGAECRFTSNSYTLESLGKFDSAARDPLSAVGSGIRVIHGSGINDLDSKNWTIEFWHKPKNIKSGSTDYYYSRLIARINGDLEIGYHMMDTGNNAVRYYIGNWEASFNLIGLGSYAPNAAYQITGLKSVTWSTGDYASDWVHVAITHEYLGNDQHNWKMFIDGVGYSNLNDYYLTSGSTDLYVLPAITGAPSDDGSNYPSTTYNLKPLGQLDEFHLVPYVKYTNDFTPTTEEFPLVPSKQGYAIIEPRVSLTAIGWSVVFGWGQFDSIFDQDTDYIRYRSTSFNNSSNFSQTTAAGLLRTTNVDFSVAVNQLAQAVSVLSASSLQNSSFSQSSTVDKIKGAVVNLNSEFTQTTTAVKTVEVLAAVDSQFTQTSAVDRYRSTTAAFEVLHSTVTAAAKNATGTVLLESRFAATAQAQITADQPQSLSSEFSQQAAAARTRDLESSITVTGELSCQAERVQPTGADLSISTEMAVSISKITGYSADLAVETDQTVTANRLRSTTANQNSAVTLTADNQILRLAQAGLESEFTVLASPRFIVRITAEFTALATTLTVSDVLNIDPYLTLVIKPESRTIVIESETRALRIRQETRDLIIEGYE